MKKLFLVLISTVLFAFSATAADMRIALVVKGLIATTEKIFFIFNNYHYFSFIFKLIEL